LKKYSYLSILVTVSFLVFDFGNASAAPGSSADSQPQLNNLTSYPRIEQFEQGSVQVDFPALESWPEFRYLKAWLPVEVSLPGENQPRAHGN
jgi:hypothetical protein